MTSSTEQLLDIVKAPKTSPAALIKRPSSDVTGVGGGTLFLNNAKVPVSNPRLYRHWAKHSEWIRGAINIRKSQVSSAEWDIVPFDQTKRVPERQRKALRDLLQTPNPANDSFRTFVEPIVEDLITLDAGCIEKVRSMDGALRELWPVDGATIKVNALWDGDPEEDRYFWWPDHKERGKFKNADFIYMMANRRTDSPVGLSPLETLKLTIEAELNAHEYNRRQVAAAAPDGIMNLGEGFSEQQVISFRNFFESEVAGRGALGFIGGTKDPGFIKFRDSNRDMQFLEWQIYLVRKIAVVMGLTPQDLGVTFDVNRSTSEVQLQVSEDRGLRPLMSMVQEYITEEIVWDSSFGGPNNNLAFRFTALNLKESTARAEVNKLALGGVPWKFINEARIGEGREPIPELEGKLIMSTPTGAVDISDVPTVREMMEVQNAKREAPPAAKDVDLDVLASKIAQLMPGSAPSVTIEKGAVEVNVENGQPNISVDANTTVSDGAIRVEPVTYEEGSQHFAEGAVQLDQRPEVLVDTAPVVVEMTPVTEQLEEIRKLLASVPPVQPTVLTLDVERDEQGAITGRVKHMSDGSEIHEVVRRDANGRMIGIGPKE